MDFLKFLIGYTDRLEVDIHRRRQHVSLCRHRCRWDPFTFTEMTPIFPHLLDVGLLS